MHNAGPRQGPHFGGIQAQAALAAHGAADLLGGRGDGGLLHG